MMQWKKDPNMRYVDMCIYIDEHVPRLLEPDCPVEIQENIYNYLWLLAKALAIKEKMFSSFQDYDGYAFYAANRIYFALKKNLMNQGKIVKGKEIRPIKSCLNYMKALLRPMKIEFLMEEHNTNTSGDAVTKNFDSFMIQQQVQNNAWQSQGGAEIFYSTVHDLFKHFNATLDSVLAKLPFPAETADYKKLKISLLLNVYFNLKSGKGLTAEPVTIILWKLPHSMSNYVKLLLKELGTALKQVIIASYTDTVIDERILKYMIANPGGEFIEREN